MRIFIIALVSAMVVCVSCADSNRVGEVKPLPQFVEQQFCYTCPNIDINIVCQRIVDAESDCAWKHIDLENCARTLPHLDADTILVSSDVEPAVEAFIRSACEDAKTYNIGYVYKLNQKSLLVRNNEVLCYQTEIYSYAGGIHGSEQLIFDCYDLKSGSAYDFYYLLDMDAEWGRAMAELLSTRLMEQHADIELEISADEIYIPESVMISDTGLLFVYQPYDLASYAYGTIAVEIADEEIAATGAPLVWVHDSE